MANPSVRLSASAASASSSTCAVAITGTPANGELILAICQDNENPTFAAPAISGFSTIASITTADWNPLYILGKIASSEGTNPTYTATWSGGAGPLAPCMAILVIQDAKNALPTNTASTHDTSASTTFSIPALTTAVNNSLDLVAVTHDGNVGTTANNYSAWGTSLVEVLEFYDGSNSGYPAFGIAAVTRASAGSQAATTVTSVANDKNVALRIEIEPVAAVAANPALDDSDAATITSGTVQAAIAGSEASAWLATIEEVLPVDGPTVVLDRPDEDSDVMDEVVENMPVNLLNWAASHATLEAQKSEEWIPESGAAPVLERPDEDDSSDDLGIDADIPRLYISGLQAALSTLDEAEQIPVSGAFPVLDPPAEEESDEAVFFAPLIDQTVAEEEVLLVDGSPVVIADNPFEDDSAYIADQVFDPSVAEEEAIPTDGAAPVLERPDEDEDGAQLLPRSDTSYEATQRAIEDAEVIPVDGAAPVLERADEEDEQVAALQPALDTSWYAAQLAIDDAEVLPLDGATPVLEVAGEDDSPYIAPPIFDPTVAEDEVLPVDGTVFPTVDQPVDEDPYIAEPVFVDPIVQPEELPASGATPVLGRPDDDEDGAQLLPTPDNSWHAAQIAIAEAELQPVDGYIVPIPPIIEEDEQIGQFQPVPDTSCAVAQYAVEDGEVIPASGAINADRNLPRQLGGGSTGFTQTRGGVVATSPRQTGGGVAVTERMGGGVVVVRGA